MICDLICIEELVGVNIWFCLDDFWLGCWDLPCFEKHLHEWVRSKSLVNDNLDDVDLFNIYIEFLDIYGLNGVYFYFILFM